MKGLYLPPNTNSVTNYDFWSLRWDSVAERIQGWIVYLGYCSWNQLCDAVDSVANDRNKFVEAINTLVSVVLMKKFEDDESQNSDISLGDGSFCFAFSEINFNAILSTQLRKLT